MRKIRKGDDVIVISGKDKGKHASVTKLLNNQKVLVQGINKAKKHQKPNPTNNTSGGIVEIEQPVHISNVAIYNFQTKKADKVGIVLNSEGIKTRVFKSNGEQLDS